MEELEGLSAVEKTIFYLLCKIIHLTIDAKVVRDFVLLTQELGNFTPILLPFKPNGKAMHIQGFLKRFSKTAQKSSRVFKSNGKIRHFLLCWSVDPAIVLSYRDEYKESTTRKNGGDFHVLTARMVEQDYKMRIYEGLKNITKTDRTFDWYLFRICRIYFYEQSKEWQEILEDLDNKQCEKVGCCEVYFVIVGQVHKIKK